jgi:hypothetical protein
VESLQVIFILANPATTSAKLKLDDNASLGAYRDVNLTRLTMSYQLLHAPGTFVLLDVVDAILLDPIF